MRAILSRLPRTDSSLELVGPAAGTAELPVLARRLRPGVVVVSEDQLLGLEQLHRQYPVPVLLYSTSPPLPGMLRQVKSLGVYGYLPPAPTGGPELWEWCRQAKAKLAAARPEPSINVPVRSLTVPLPPRGIVVIGGSTGGAPAVERILTMLPANFPWAVLVAVHLPVHFTGSLVDRLRRATTLPVAAASSGARLEAGRVLVAPGGHNLVVRPVAEGPWLGWQTDFASGASLDVPSVDMLMESVARLAGRQVVGVVLTGLGQDGTAGARAIRQLGGTVVVQNEASSVVFSMPKSVIQAGHASAVLPLADVAEYLVRHVQRPVPLVAATVFSRFSKALAQ
ncbi:chemotaxis protein CheB [Hymenobacter rubripertinctus]|uniref:protein-glutamate methylesterase n=1 Tax=Hymenobacter rubripertinctus TaxID=2029981 RepID=A0A418R764_9BACT|nr:chemotaxis protein CheB [Hymenobacter rubripertinctus]